MSSVIAISVGAIVGALLRWWLALQLNTTGAAIAWGTLVANCVGGYLIGVAAAYFHAHPGLSPEWRLLIITGFLGALTTFSTFSLEVVTLLQQARYGAALASSSAHLIGSLLCTVAGMATVRWLAQTS